MAVGVLHEAGSYGGRCAGCAGRANRVSETGAVEFVFEGLF